MTRALWVDPGPLLRNNLHALWYIRVWSIRVSTGFLKKIRVYQYPFSGIFKGIFLREYSDYEMVKGGYKGTPSTHSNGLRRVISTDKIQSNPWVAVDLFEGDNLQKTITCFSKCSHTKELIVK